MATLKHKTISGIKWTFAASIVQRIISFGTTVVLARILSPADFGLFALAFVMIDGFGIFKSLGFDSALVRRKNSDIERACNTAFFLIPAMGMILFAILYFFAPIGAKFLNNPQVTPLIRTLAIVFVISTFGKVPQTVLYRDMKFKYKSIAEVSSSIIYATTALGLASAAFGVWSLVVGYILKTLTLIAIEWYFSGWKPKFEFDKAIAWDMFHFGKYVLASSFLWFLYNNLDNIIIGKLLGVAMLGYYAISMNIAKFLSEYFLDKVGKVIYPTYSKVHEDAIELERSVLKVLKYVSSISFPASFYLFAFSKEILLYIFGDKWVPASNILKILAFVGLFRSLGTVIWPAYLAKGRSKVDFQINIMQVIGFFILLIPLTKKFALNGVGLAILITTLISFLIGLFRAKRFLLIEPLKILKVYLLPFVASFLTFVPGAYLRTTSQENAFLSFLLISGFSIVIYILIITLFDHDFFKELKKDFLNKGEYDATPTKSTDSKR